MVKTLGLRLNGVGKIYLVLEQSYNVLLIRMGSCYGLCGFGKVFNDKIGEQW